MATRKPHPADWKRTAACRVDIEAGEQLGALVTKRATPNHPWWWCECVRGHETIKNVRTLRRMLKAGERVTCTECTKEQRQAVAP